MSRVFSCMCMVALGCSSPTRAAAGASGAEATSSTGATRALDTFTAIQLDGSIDVVAKMGAPQTVTVIAADDVIPNVVTRVRGKTLHVHFKDDYSTSKRCRVEVTLKALNKVSVHGSGDFEGAGVDAEDLEVSVRGSGDIELSGNARSVDVEVHGSGDVKIHGKTEKLEASVHGSGDISLFGLESEEAEVDVMGSGDVKVSVSKTLTASIHGSGDIIYKGAAKVRQTVFGSGDVRHVD